MDLINKLKYITKYFFNIFISTIIILSVFIVISIPSFINNGAFSKSYETKYVMTDGDKIIVFQGMNHIGLTSFYKEVGEEMTAYRNDGYKIFLEGLKHNGIKPLKKSDSEYLSKLNFYNLMAEEYRVKNKKYFNNKYSQQMYILNQYYAYDDEYADMTEQEYNNIIGNTTVIHEANTTIDAHYNKKVEALKTVTDHTVSYNKILQDDKLYIISKNINNTYFMKKIMNGFVSLEYWYDNTFTKDKNLFYDIVMVKRNKIIVDYLLKSESKKIYINYGSAHFDGVFKLLKEENPNWKIVEVSKKLSFNVE